MKIRLLFRCMVSVAIGLLIAITISFSIMAFLYDLSLTEIFDGLVKYSIGIVIAYLIMIPLVYIEQVKKAKSDKD
jgi:uncharacterized membrane protein